VFDALDDGFDGFNSNRPFFECALKAGAQFFLVKGFANAVLLNHAWHYELSNLVGGEALFTVEAFASTANLIAFGDKA
jgi:hypothetical protein